MITATDRRHGSRAGYLAGCREDCCADPNYRYQKRSRIRLQREGTQIVSAADVVERAHWWGERGVATGGLTAAAGIGDGTLVEILAGERDVCLKSTAHAVLALTWDDLLDKSLCASDLTRLRIYSMMAAGHRLDWISENTGDGLPISGAWRRQARVTIGTARAVQRLYDRAPLQGPSKHSASKARNKGHRHPLAWDDPGVPAMPFGWDPFEEPAEAPLIGRPPVAPSVVEDFEWITRAGVSETEAAERVGYPMPTIRTYRRRYSREAS